jgi:hypothetical protein
LLGVGSQHAGSLGGTQHPIGGAGSQQTGAGWQQAASIGW